MSNLIKHLELLKTPKLIDPYWYENEYAFWEQQLNYAIELAEKELEDAYEEGYNSASEPDDAFMPRSDLDIMDDYNE